MEYITAATAAKEWGISASEVETLCIKGLVKGALRNADKVWTLPQNTVKPAEKEKVGGAQRRKK